jgi:hypothetical protein
VTDHELRAIYEYLKAILCNPGQVIPGAPYLQNEVSAVRAPWECLSVPDLFHKKESQEKHSCNGWTFSCFAAHLMEQDPPPQLNRSMQHHLVS